jgi:hypothetical protein
MKITPIRRQAPPTQADVIALDGVQLVGPHAARLEAAQALNNGPRAWQVRKLREARDLVALAQLAPGRCVLLDLDLQGDLTAVFALNVPVPQRLRPDNSLLVAQGALLGLRYPADAVRLPKHGASFFQVLDPRIEWHPNVHAEKQMLCLGTKLPAGILVRELVLMAYHALSLQSVQVDESDPAGVMNLDAARWWQANLHRAPLTRDPFVSAAVAAPEKRGTHE